VYDVTKRHGPEELTPIESAGPEALTRRRVLGAAAGAAVLGAGTAARAAEPQSSSGKRIKSGRIKQSLVQWCYAPYWDVPQMIKVAKQLGCGSIELLDAKYYPLLKESGLECAIGTIDMSPDAPFVKGFNNPKYRDKVIKATRDAIDACAAFGHKNVISFTGMSEGIPADVGANHCVEGFKQIIGHAEKKKVTLCLEMLNTRDSSHPMKGHPGYQGNHTEYCVDIINRVGSPNLKLLFDIYHVQIMDGDVIRRIRQHKDVIAHIHTAGNPGRGELDDKQEIAYKPIMEALVEIGYQGYVGQEFIPVRDPLAGLEQAVTLCDV
jgi:hydroxypyruvate isomerase